MRALTLQPINEGGNPYVQPLGVPDCPITRAACCKVVMGSGTLVESCPHFTTAGQCTYDDHEGGDAR